jgi:hypothetical protein
VAVEEEAGVVIEERRYGVICALPIRPELSHGDRKVEGVAPVLLIALSCFASCASRACPPMFGRILNE